MNLVRTLSPPRKAEFDLARLTQLLVPLPIDKDLLIRLPLGLRIRRVGLAPYYPV